MSVSVTVKVEPAPGLLSTVMSPSISSVEPPHDRKAEAGAAEAPRGRGIGLRERLEQPRALLLVKPMPVSRTASVTRVAPSPSGCVPARTVDAAALGELQRVAEQVEQDLPHAGRIADQRVVRAGVDRRRRAAAPWRSPAGGTCSSDAVDQAGERERGVLQLEPAGLDLGEVEHVVDDAQQRLRRIAHGRHACVRCASSRPWRSQHLHHAEHAVHRRADLVAHGGEEGRFRLVGGFRLGARRLGGLLGGGERLLAVLQLGDVADNRDDVAVRSGMKRNSRCRPSDVRRSK